MNAPHPEETHSLDAPGPTPVQPSDNDPIGLTEEELAMVQAAVNGRAHHVEPTEHAETVPAVQTEAVPEATPLFEAQPDPKPQAPRRPEAVFGPAHHPEAVLGPPPAPEPEPVEVSGGRMRQAWDQIQMAFPRLMGQPAYWRPRSMFAPAERPFDPDDLPLEAERSADDRRAAEILATTAGSKERSEGGRGWRSVTRLLRLGD